LVLTDIDYADVPGLSNEARGKLEAARPRTVGQAGRLDGLTPAALGILAAYLRREARRKTSKATA
jgi:tRNA uridine 5-carboxymethylaminomethyl modification enzyme